MIFKITNKEDLNVDKRPRFDIQVGTDTLTDDTRDYIGYGYTGLFLIGSTSSNSSVGKFALNTSVYNEEFSNEVPWQNYTSWWYPEANVLNIYTDRKTYARLEIEANNPDSYLNKFKPGDQLLIRRLNIKRVFTIANISLSNKGYVLITLLNDRKYQTDNFEELDNFINKEGYPLSDGTAWVTFLRKIEKQPGSYLKELKVEFNEYEFLDGLSIKVVWLIDPAVKATRLRWRSVPRNQKETIDFSFNIVSGGSYVRTPEVKLISDTGRSAKVIPVMSGGTGGTVTNLILDQIGGGYLSSPSIVFEKFSLNDSGILENIEIIPAEATCELSLRTESRVDYIRVLEGGTGYTGADVFVSPSVVPISYPQGVTAIGQAEIEDGVIKNIVLVDGGYGFTFGPYFNDSVTIVPHGTGGTGAILKPNLDIMSEWIYEEPIYHENFTIIHGLKRGIPYEIQILCSNDENFKGNNFYSQSLNFSYF